MSAKKKQMMKRHYVKRSREWMTQKAMDFLVNLLRNHDMSIDDSDVFESLADSEPAAHFSARLSRAFSECEIQPFNVERRGRRNPPNNCMEEIDEVLCALWSEEANRPRVRKLVEEMVADHKKAVDSSRIAKEIFPRKLTELQKTLGLTDFERDVFLVTVLIHQNLLEWPERGRRRMTEAQRVDCLAKFLDCDSHDVLSAVAENGRLRRYRCLDGDFDFNRGLTGFLNGMDEEPFCSQFFTLRKTEALPLAFYGELADKHGSIVKDLIRSGKGKRPVNILLYGAPGTGKTSFARTLAAELGLACYFINQDTGDDDRALGKPEHRFGALQICNNRIERAQSLIVVDEADEMLRGRRVGMFPFFGGGASHVGDKGMLNAVLDEVRTPTIWITNTTADELDPSSRRRFDYSVRFEPLSASQRLAIWKNNVQKMKLSRLFSERQLTAFSARYAVSAGGITQTIKNLAELKPSGKDVESLVEKLMTPHCELMEISTMDETLKPAHDYSLEGLNIKGSVPLDRIVEAVRNFQKGGCGETDRPRMNILLSGSPGTGKTEFVKHLGAVLDTKVSVKMGSDILSMYVGGTEKNIRRVFAEAEAEKSILFLDEIDGLVQSRAGAQRSWEVTQVNELLHRMENFKGVMIGATNFGANLDAAILRRFTFKLDFDWLTGDGKVLFFERMFQTKLTEAEKNELAAIPNLAPGDFRTVRQSLFYLGGTITTADRLAALTRESEAKGRNAFAERAAIGF